LTATTSAHGCKAVAKSDWSVLASRDVVILRDNDAVGLVYAESVAQILVALGCTVRIILLPDLPPAGDIADLVAACSENQDPQNIARDVERLVGAAPLWKPPEQAISSPDKQKKPDPAVVEITTLSEIEPKDVQWLWRNRFPLGMLSVISGDPNVGKSTVVTDMAARITSGTPWPDLRLEPNPVGSVVLLVAEDGIADTVRVRIDNAQGNPSRVFILQGIRRPKADYLDQFQIDQDLHHLDAILQEHPDVRMVGIDPLDAFLGDATDSNKKSDIQRTLSGLSHLAERCHVAVVGVLHLRKSNADKAMYRTLGSLGFVSAPRAVWAVSRDRSDNSRRLMTCVKLNVAPEPTGLSFTIEGAGVLAWGVDPVQMSADEALEAARPRTRTARDDAGDWLLELLAPGPMGSECIEKLATDEGINWRTLNRAKKERGVRAKKKTDGDKIKWYWEIGQE